MLVLMYNKAAQEDFLKRLTSLVSGQPLPQIRTFHSLGLKIYDRLINMGALPQWQGKVLSDGETENIVWRLLQEIADDDTRQDILSQRRKWVEPAMAFLDLVKSGLMPAADVLETLDYPPECRIFTELFYRFEAGAGQSNQRKHQSNTRSHHSTGGFIWARHLWLAYTQ